MKISNLESLIISTLGGNTSNSKPSAPQINSAYVAPVVQQPVMPVNDSQPAANGDTSRTLAGTNSRRPASTNSSHSTNHTQNNSQPATVQGLRSNGGYNTSQQPLKRPIPYSNNLTPQQENLTPQKPKIDAAYTQKIEEALATLVPGTDFGSIAGIKGNVLFKPALVKILRHLGYKYNTKLVDKQLAGGILAYTVEVTVINSDGEFVCSALGSSNSGEKKFSDKALSSDNILIAIASTRGLRACVKDILVR